MKPERIIELQEFTTTQIPRDQLSEADGEVLWREYGKYVDVRPPSFTNGFRWQLASRGWVGSIPLNDELRIILKPKVQLGNLFGMLEYAYRLKSFHLLEGITESESLEEAYERLAGIFARRVLDRSRKGLYRAYVAQSDRLPYLRGSLDVQRLMRSPVQVDLHCHYEEHTADVEENQILAWTLDTIVRQGICSERVQPIVRAAHRSLHGVVSLRSFDPHDCIDRLYNRLNDDYQPLHALCRFFLEQSGPSHQPGDRKMLPFLVDMARLYELFVAEWLKQHLPNTFRLKAQERINLDEEQRLNITIDLVLYDRASDRPIAVLDTKYKNDDTPSPSDRDQVVAYAAALRCREAVLIYPVALARPFNARYGASDIRVRTVAFGLDGDLEEAGRRFLHELLRQSA